MSIIKSVDENYNDIYKNFTPKMDEEINLYKTAFSSQRDAVKNDYNSLITDSNESYYDEENRQAIQKIVNEKKIAENMENLGLTDSGLNRTQQTAVQLSYSNNQAKLERQRQKAVDALNLEMTGKLTEIDTKESDTVASIKDKYHQAALSAAQEAYNADVKAETERIQAEIDAATALSKERIKASAKSVTDDSNDNSNSSNIIFNWTKEQDWDDKGNLCNVYYGSDGQPYLVKVGTNPYTNTKNSNSESAKLFGFFDNGYQPRGVYGVGEVHPTGHEIYDTGKKQNVWYTKDKKGNKRYWVWIGDDNGYQEFTYNSNTGKYKATSTVVYVK